jgi:Rieske Fe-S protein
MPRRSFFAWLTALVGGLAALAFLVPFAGYLLGALRRKRQEWLPLGPVSKFPVGETRLATFNSPLGQPWDGQAAHNGVYVRNLGEGKFLVFAMNCAHLGCPVSWFPAAGLFMCPCHGGVYYENGERASGPPTRGLFPCPWRVTDGVLQVQAPHFPTLQDV